MACGLRHVAIALLTIIVTMMGVLLAGVYREGVRSSTNRMIGAATVLYPAILSEFSEGPTEIERENALLAERVKALEAELHQRQSSAMERAAEEAKQECLSSTIC